MLRELRTDNQNLGAESQQLTVAISGISGSISSREPLRALELTKTNFLPLPRTGRAIAP